MESQGRGCQGGACHVLCVALIVRGIVRTCLDLGIDLVAEGIETPGELAWCRAEGLELFQGNLIAEAAFEQLPVPRIPGSAPA